ncbi:hypothetical protein P3T76_006558 [Phytophthora citrophthora]|uniref:Uncharacterized protein n=1 Tax=Phytophthora citrophthora TaxID=4793 RepID=A0AAD9GPM1_9STRA|nr:hypothetical protein P3T76_006558 [Phytophthora citrophthora]
MSYFLRGTRSLVVAIALTLDLKESGGVWVNSQSLTVLGSVIDFRSGLHSAECSVLTVQVAVHLVLIRVEREFVMIAYCAARKKAYPVSLEADCYSSSKSSLASDRQGAPIDPELVPIERAE